jgi:hypothetical protein
MLGCSRDVLACRSEDTFHSMPSFLKAGLLLQAGMRVPNFTHMTRAQILPHGSSFHGTKSSFAKTVQIQGIYRHDYR